jgi:acid phosphatase (class A)
MRFFTSAFVVIAGGAALAAGISVAQVPGFLGGSSFKITQVLSPPPIRGGVRDEHDRIVFRKTRSLQGSPRWAMAIGDIQTDNASMMRDFSCAAGLSLNPGTAPHLSQLISRAGADTAAQTNIAKRFFHKLRPFKIDSGPICEPAADVENSFDYPSGHATWGWTWASILAELLPDRAPQILARGRAYGESRIVCGVHNASAVEAGRISAEATLLEVRATSDYRRDLAAAREEIKRLKALRSAPPVQQCTAEESLVHTNIFPP